MTQPQDGFEIERKWVLTEIPQKLPSDFALTIEVDQAYLLTNPALRIRQEIINGNSTYYLTSKSDGTLAVAEWESQIPEWMYSQHRTQAIGDVQKTRYVMANDGHKYEFDVFKNNLAGLILLEVEWIFPNDSPQYRQIALDFVLPDFVANAIEVTEDKRYKNASLALYGFPKNATGHPLV